MGQAGGDAFAERRLDRGKFGDGFADGLVERASDDGRFVRREQNPLVSTHCIQAVAQELVFLHHLGGLVLGGAGPLGAVTGGSGGIAGGIFTRDVGRQGFDQVAIEHGQRVEQDRVGDVGSAGQAGAYPVFPLREHGLAQGEHAARGGTEVTFGGGEIGG